MNLAKLLFVLSALGILLILFISYNLNKPYYGKISSIRYYKNKIIFSFENTPKEGIVFSNKKLELNKGDKIKFYGKEDDYGARKQIIIDKIILLDNGS